MGNKIGRKRQVVDDKYTRPQGLYQHRDIDQKKLRKLILESKLAPCYPGDEESAPDLEECPICFLYYPSLNRSRCCMKGICTECFLQMKPPHQNRPTQYPLSFTLISTENHVSDCCWLILNTKRCPFCKTSNYAVEYRGVKTKEEKGMEQIEEQKVIEAQIRIRQQELQDEVDKIKKRQGTCSSSRTRTPLELEYHDLCSNSFSAPSFKCARQANDFFSSQASCSAPPGTGSSHLRQNRDDNFDMDLEDIMVMEAIWLSIQEQGSQGNPAYSGSLLPGPSYSEEFYNHQVIAPLRTSPSGGLACAAAALAERQHMNGSSTPVFDMHQHPGNFHAGNARIAQNTPRRWIEISPENGREVREEFGECSTDHWSEAAEVGTSYAGSDVMVDAGPSAFPFPEGTNVPPGNFVPESYEEQMMLAMAVSLAEARSRMGNQGLSWH